ncbi:MAG: hypothetical protein U9R74_01345, partial [Pseudomonadota bacterium]|nr:hypothetical protein [Pseudomonadota bacterium]
MDPSLVMFAIESAVRLGNKLNEVLVDKVHERPLVLPLGDSYADVTEIKAVRFFDQPENIHLVLEGGPYFGFDNEELKKAYRTLLEIDERLDAKGSTLSKARNTVEDLYRFEQFKEGLGADSPAQKLLGTIVNIGIDYFSRYPQALGEQNNGRKVVQAFVSRLDVEMIAEGTPRAAVGHVLLSALHVLDDRVSLVDDDERLQVLLSGVTQAVIGEVEEAGSAGETDRRQDLFKRIGRSILRGGVTAFTENAGLFFQGDDEAK